MILLAIETATTDVATALVTDDGVLDAFVERETRHHVELLHPAIAALLSRHELSAADLDAVAVDVGPGLFTGLRVGIAAAKGLAAALGVPLVGCTSIEVLEAAAEREARPGESVVAAVDMRRGEMSWSLPGSDALVLGGVGELVDGLRRAASGAGVLLVGDGARRYEDELRAALVGEPRVRLGGAQLAAPPPGVLGELGRARVARGRAVDPYELGPVYLRDADARVNFATRPAAPR